jgi:hypothetical protein
VLGQTRTAITAKDPPHLVWRAAIRAGDFDLVGESRPAVVAKSDVVIVRRTAMRTVFQGKSIAKSNS